MSDIQNSLNILIIPSKHIVNSQLEHSVNRVNQSMIGNRSKMCLQHLNIRFKQADIRLFHFKQSSQTFTNRQYANQTFLSDIQHLIQTLNSNIQSVEVFNSNIKIGILNLNIHFEHLNRPFNANVSS